MECNKDEARLAMETAEKKLSDNDYVGAKKFANKAHNLYPNLEGLNQLLLMVDVYISASKNGKGEEADWYGVLGVDPLADEETVKKKYKKLALLLHPDKNKCKGAEEAFKLVSEAWCLLSDKAKRISFDQKMKSKTGMHKPVYNNGNRGVDPSAKARSNKPAPAPAPAGSSNQEKWGTICTMCNKCKTQYAYIRDNRLGNFRLCPSCGVRLRPVPNFLSSPQHQHQQQQRSTQNKNTNGALLFLLCFMEMLLGIILWTLYVSAKKVGAT